MEIRIMDVSKAIGGSIFKKNETVIITNDEIIVISKKQEHTIFSRTGALAEKIIKNSYTMPTE